MAPVFSYLRYFAILCLVLVGLGAFGLSIYFKEIKGKELINSTVWMNQGLLTSFGDTIWPRYAIGMQAGDSNAASDFNSEAARFFAPQQFSKVTIFSSDVSRLYYSSTNAIVNDKNQQRVTLFSIEQVRKGQPVSRLLDNVYIKGSASNNTGAHTMLQLILPIMRTGFSEADRIACQTTSMPKCNPLALAEMYVDITASWRQLRMMQYLIIGTMVGMFLMIISLLLYTSWRAEAIIARQHEVNLELTAAAAAAEAQSRDKSQFLASVSHELRTPLNAIIGFSDIIKNEARGQLEKTYQDYVDDIYGSGKHLLSLINDILDYSKAEAGKLQIEWAETDATKVIRNSLRMVLPRAETAQVTMVEDIPSHHLVVVTDAKKLKQVLLNLLSNAVKFTPAGGAVRCHAWEDVVKQSLILQVRDTGIGIAPKDISKVMQPFGQVDSALSRKYEGTGLGLPLSKKFIEAMGGKFDIESELGVGTTITITVPKTPKNWQNDSQNTNPEAETAEGVAHVAPEQPDGQTS
jgi:two-component system cell cycle sensor histidine kinase PleC